MTLRSSPIQPAPEASVCACFSPIAAGDPVVWDSTEAEFIHAECMEPTPVEQIQSAIDKLTRLKAESTEGPWTAWKQIGAHGRRYGVEAGTLDDVLISRNAADAQLIETLRVTIDAQLEVLAEAFKLQRIADGSSFARMTRLVLPGLILARAINGGA